MAKKKPEAPEKDMLSLKEAADYLGISRSAISQAIARGRLVKKRVAVFVEEWRISRAALDAYEKTRGEKVGRPRTPLSKK